MKMALGPLQLLAVAFEKPTLDGSVLAELNALRDRGFIRLVDALAVYKDEAGDVTTVETSDLSYDEFVGAGHTIGALIGLSTGNIDVAREAAAQMAINADYLYENGMSEERIASIADAIPAGGGALLMLVEHVWLKPFRDAARMQGGIVLAQDFLSPEALLGLL
jgi:uncharacterized membrane protein